ncbi:MAG: VanZ family protein [Chloroflexota bacterium]
MPSSSIKIVTLLFALFVLAIILLADTGLLPGALQFVHSIPYGDKVAHFLLIGVLCFLLSWTAIQSYPHTRPGHIVALVCLAMVLIFGVEEASQGPIRGRDASLFDLSADYVGIVVFGWLAWKLAPRRAAPM